MTLTPGRNHAISILFAIVVLPVFAYANGAQKNDTVVETAGVLNSRKFPLERSTKVKGWVNQPNTRGTFDIIWICLITILICTYSMLILNIPARTDGPWRIARRRLIWIGITIMGPEFPLTYAAGQWSRARHSVAAFKDSNLPNWNMRLAFFADMGGFVLEPSDGKAFPLTAKQLHWLVVQEKIPPPELTVEEIWDKSKQDRLVRAITAFQAGYFILQCIGRAAQGLAITTLELNTLAIVVCSLMTSFAWLHKPAEVRVPHVIKTSLTVEAINDGQPWDLTPLDFIDDHSPGYSVNVQPFMGMPVIPPERPMQRIPDDRFPTNPYGAQEWFLCFATLLFTGIHVAGWNYYFPSFAEKILWRVTSLSLFGITFLFWILETAASWVRLGTWERVGRFAKRTIGLRFRKKVQTTQNKEGLEPKPPFPAPWEFWSISTLAVLYGIARLYLLVEGFVELRTLPASAFLNVEWTDFIPHV